MHCLDSDFLIEVLRGDAAAIRLLRAIEAEGRPRISAVSAFEVTDTVRPARREAALAALATLEVLPVDGSVAVAASQMSVALREGGRVVPMADLLIGATCVLGDLVLVTRNTKHFARVRGLRLATW
jgi:predicted nucleic acid-binding protein